MFKHRTTHYLQVHSAAPSARSKRAVEWSMFLSFVDDKKRYKGAKVGGTLHLHLALQ